MCPPVHSHGMCSGASQPAVNLPAPQPTAVSAHDVAEVGSAPSMVHHHNPLMAGSSIHRHSLVPSAAECFDSAPGTPHAATANGAESLPATAAAACQSQARKGLEERQCYEQVAGLWQGRVEGEGREVGNSQIFPALDSQILAKKRGYMDRGEHVTGSMGDDGMGDTGRAVREMSVLGGAVVPVRKRQQRGVPRSASQTDAKGGTSRNMGKAEESFAVEAGIDRDTGASIQCGGSALTQRQQPVHRDQGAGGVHGVDRNSASRGTEAHGARGQAAEVEAGGQSGSKSRASSSAHCCTSMLQETRASAVMSSLHDPGGTSDMTPVSVVTSAPASSRRQRGVRHSSKGPASEVQCTPADPNTSSAADDDVAIPAGCSPIPLHYPASCAFSIHDAGFSVSSRAEILPQPPSLFTSLEDLHRDSSVSVDDAHHIHVDELPLTDWLGDMQPSFDLSNILSDAEPVNGRQVDIAIAQGPGRIHPNQPNQSMAGIALVGTHDAADSEAMAAPACQKSRSNPLKQPKTAAFGLSSGIISEADKSLAVSSVSEGARRRRSTLSRQKRSANHIEL